MASGEARVLPDFLIIGAQKAGTTSLYGYLAQFPDVREATTKEVHFFDHNFDRGERWYRGHFPAGSRRRDWLTGEATPFYLLHPAAPSRVEGVLHDVRLVALLRNPVTRSYSHFQHSRARGVEPLEDFEQALVRESERTDAPWRALMTDGARQPAVETFSYVRRSLYAPQLQRWLDVFPRDSLLLLTAEELFADPADVLRRTRTHLGLPPLDAPVNFQIRNARSYPELPFRVREQLGARFADDVAAVERLLGRPTGWRL